MNMPSNLLMTKTGLSSFKWLPILPGRCVQYLALALFHVSYYDKETKVTFIPKVTFMQPITNEARNVIHIQEFKNFLHPLLATNWRQPGIDESWDFPSQNGELSIRFLEGLIRNF